MSEHNNYWGILPANVRYSTLVCANAKLLYTELTALTHERGYCWATNEYFAKLYEVKKGTISCWFSQLRKAGFITIEVTSKEKGYDRKIYLVDASPLRKKVEGIEEISHTPTINDEEALRKNDDTLCDQNSIPSTIKAEQNITLNNTKNSTGIIKKEGSAEEYNDLLAMQRLKQHLLFCWGSDIRIKYTELCEFIKLSQRHGTENVFGAIHEAAIYNKRSIAYVRGILEPKFKTVANIGIDFRKLDEERERAKFLALMKSGNRLNYTQ